MDSLKKLVLRKKEGRGGGLSHRSNMRKRLERVSRCLLNWLKDITHTQSDALTLSLSFGYNEYPVRAQGKSLFLA